MNWLDKNIFSFKDRFPELDLGKSWCTYLTLAGTCGVLIDWFLSDFFMDFLVFFFGFLCEFFLDFQMHIPDLGWNLWGSYWLISQWFFLWISYWIFLGFLCEILFWGFLCEIIWIFRCTSLTLAGTYGVLLIEPSERRMHWNDTENHSNMVTWNHKGCDIDWIDVSIEWREIETDNDNKANNWIAHRQSAHHIINCNSYW